jgi:hypothetical protein
MLTHKWQPYSFEVRHMEHLVETAGVSFEDFDIFSNDRIFPPKDIERLESAIEIINTSFELPREIQRTLLTYLIQNQCLDTINWLFRLSQFKREEQKELKRRKKRGCTNTKVDALTNLWVKAVRVEWLKRTLAK